jgi:hypothetical protein
MEAHKRETVRFFHSYELPPGTVILKVLGVDYAHIKTREGGDLYLTRFGVPFLDLLRPENWYARDWFRHNREKLAGTSTVYRLSTRTVNRRSKDIVVKWCRVGEEVPLDTFTLSRFINAEFNTPWEEFSLVMNLRTRRKTVLIRTHKPLAIYVPPERFDIWQTGRSRSRIENKKAKYRDVELDIYRQYIMIYEWVKGVSIVEALEAGEADAAEREATMASITEKAILDLEKEGFRVLDMKPAHVIVRPGGDGRELLNRKNDLAYALVDFELLERTPQYEREVLAQRRAEYFKRQEGRFFTIHYANFPPHLHHINIFGVDYVYGATESTTGVLWVAGNDPALFDYFLPERWRRTRRTRLAPGREIYHTKTKDNIHLVWKVSRVGEVPSAPAAEVYGYNSPFEEFAYALELGHMGLKTIFPRAIYMTGIQSGQSYVQDFSRYESHRSVLINDGRSVLRLDHNYITVWGFWHGPEQPAGEPDVFYEKGVDVQQAFSEKMIDAGTYQALIEKKRKRLERAGFEDQKMKGDHLLLSSINDGSLLTGKDGLPEVRMCNFELVKRIRQKAFAADEDWFD